MSKIRINDLARELECKSKSILDVLLEVGVTEKKSHSSSLEDHEAEKVRARLRAAGQTSRFLRPSRSEVDEIKTKIDLSVISKPGDALRAIISKQQAPAGAPPRFVIPTSTPRPTFTAPAAPQPGAPAVPAGPRAVVSPPAARTTVATPHVTAPRTTPQPPAGAARPATPSAPTQPQVPPPRMIVPQTGPRPAYKRPFRPTAQTPAAVLPAVAASDRWPLTTVSRIARAPMVPWVVPPAVPAKSQPRLSAASAKSAMVSTQNAASTDRPPFAAPSSPSILHFASRVPELSQTERQHILFIDAKQESFSYRYDSQVGSSREGGTPFPDPISIQTVKDSASVLSRALQRLHPPQRGRLPDLSALRDAGVQLYKAIIPEGLAKLLQDEKECAYLEVDIPAELAWIPWELLSDKKHFLCQHFKIARHLQKNTKEYRVARSRRNEKRSGRGALILKGNTDKLKGADYEHEEVQKWLRILYLKATSFTKMTTREIQNDLENDYDVCHFIGHGHYDEEHPDQSGWKMEDESILTCKEIERTILSEAVFPYLIFANACDSARTSIFDSQAYLSLLYQAFLRHGVPHYIGTLSGIPDNYEVEENTFEFPATEFALHFYGSLAHGLSIGEALATARQHFFERSGAPIWPYYVHYGDPTDKIVEKPVRHNLTFKHSTPIDPIYSYEVPHSRKEVFVDRFTELRVARELLLPLGERKSNILLIAGEPGSGKSALLRRFEPLAIKQLPELAVATAVGTQADARIPYSAFNDIFHGLIRNTRKLKQPRGEALTIDEVIVSELQRHPVLLEAFGLGEYLADRIHHYLPDRAKHLNNSMSSERDINRKKLQTEVARFLRQMSVKNLPILLALDNLDLADDDSVALFFHLARVSHNSEILLIATYRSDAIQGSPSKKRIGDLVNEARRHGAYTMSLDLSLIDDKERTRAYGFVIRYLRHKLPILSATERPGALLVRELAEYSSGNALILTELVTFLHQKNIILLSQWGKFYDTWQLKEWARVHYQFELPKSLQDLMDDRFDQLTAPLRKVLRYASIQGTEFSLEVLAVLLQMDERKLLEDLENLTERHRLIMESDERDIGPKTLRFFRFRNRTIQMHAYHKLTALKRQRLHRQVGEYLEHVYGDQRADIAGELADHFYTSQQWKNAFNYAVQAAYRAFDQGQFRRALYFFHNALEIMPMPGMYGVENLRSELEEKQRLAGQESLKWMQLAHYGPKLPVLMSYRQLDSVSNYVKTNRENLHRYVE